MFGRQPTLRTQLFFFKSYLLSALLGVAFGHRDQKPYPARLLSVGISQRKSLFE
jgi:hypothetical protein